MTVRGIQVGACTLLVAVLTAVALPGAASPATGGSATSVASLEAGVLQELNAIREEHGLSPLRINARLTAAAEQHTREMGSDGYFEHRSYDGTAFWKRIDRWYGSKGFDYWAVGENLLWSSPDVRPSAALRLWMNSPEHRANILTARWQEIGIAAVHVDNAPGAFRDLPVTIITTDFGVRR